MVALRAFPKWNSSRHVSLVIGPTVKGIASFTRHRMLSSAQRGSVIEHLLWKWNRPGVTLSNYDAKMSEIRWPK